MPCSNTPLFQAVSAGNAESVKSILSADVADINVGCGPKARTPLLEAIEKEHDTLVPILLSVDGIDLDIPDCRGRSPLLVAVSRVQLETVQLLVHAGADISRSTMVVAHEEPLTADEATDDFDVDSGNILSPLLYALSIKTTYRNRSVFGGGERHKITRLLISALPEEKGAGDDPDTVNAVNIKDEDGWTLLHHAAARGDVEVMKLLVGKGADINTIAGRDESTPLFAALFNRQNDAAVNLSSLEQIDLTASDGMQVSGGSVTYSPIFLAAIIGCLDVVRKLVEIGVDVNDAGSGNFCTPLMGAIRGQHIETVLYLLSVKGIDVNATDGRDFTALHLAASRGQLDVVRKLVDCGADVNAVNDENECPLLLAFNEEQKSVFEYLMGHDGVDISNVDFNTCRTLLHHAARKGNLELVKTLIARNVFDINALDTNDWSINRSPLMLALLDHHLDVAEYLLGLEGITANFTDENGLTAIDMVMKTISNRLDGCKTEEDSDALIEQTVRLLDRLRNGFNVPVGTLAAPADRVSLESGEAPLTQFHEAVATANLELIKWFVVRGINVNTGMLVSSSAVAKTPTSPKSPVSFLAAASPPIELSKDPSVVEYLLEVGASVTPSTAYFLYNKFGSMDGGEWINSEIVRELLDVGVDLRSGEIDAIVGSPASDEIANQRSDYLHCVKDIYFAY